MFNLLFDNMCQRNVLDRRRRKACESFSVSNSRFCYLFVIFGFMVLLFGFIWFISQVVFCKYVRVGLQEFR